MKLFEQRGWLTFDKTEIDALIAAKKFVGLNRAPRAEKIIVSLTSYAPRIRDVKYAIYSLLNQTLPPDALILWLDEDSFPQREENLPRDLLELKSFGLTIDWCENLLSYKKLIPALEKFPDDIIITADDDLYYRPDWLEILCEEHALNPDCIVAHYVNRIRLDAQGKLYPFGRWHTVTNSPVPAFRNCSGTGGGVLLKKSFLHEDVLRREIFTTLAPLADEIWFWAMAVLRGTKIKIPVAAQNELIFIDVDMQERGETLNFKNVEQGHNDVQLRQIVERYPALLETLIREDAESVPKISVVMLAETFEALNDCAQNIFSQKFPDYELIVVNRGARVNFPNLPTNFHVIDYPGGSFVAALNLGLRKAAGDYVLFKDETSLLSDDALENIAQAAYNSGADVIHFARHIRFGDEEIIADDAFSLGDEPKFLDESKQVRAALWFQDKLSGRLDTKIFRRDFLLKHAITFGDDLAEFLFAALTFADKYLIVPQAFSVCKEDT